MKVGEKIGKRVKIDEATSLVSRGYFARMCLEIDLEIPMISKFQLKCKVRKIEYDGINLVCFSCGRFNHWKDECSSKEETAPSKPKGSRTSDRENGNPSNYQGNVQKMNQDPLINPEVIDNYGPWILAPSRVRCH